MTRTYDSMQEVGWLADNGKTLRADAIAEVSITEHRSDTIDEKARPERTCSSRPHEPATRWRSMSAHAPRWKN